MPFRIRGGWRVALTKKQNKYINRVFFLIFLSHRSNRYMPNTSAKRETAAQLGGSARLAAILSTMIIIPLALLEFNARANLDGIRVDSLVLLGFLWAIAFVVNLLLCLIYNRSRFEILSRSVVLMIFVFLVLALALVWVGVVADQMPCFIGSPNCD